MSQRRRRSDGQRRGKSAAPGWPAQGTVRPIPPARGHVPGRSSPPATPFPEMAPADNPVARRTPPDWSAPSYKHIFHTAGSAPLSGHCADHPDSCPAEAGPRPASGWSASGGRSPSHPGSGPGRRSFGPCPSSPIQSSQWSRRSLLFSALFSFLHHMALPQDRIPDPILHFFRMGQ